MKRDRKQISNYWELEEVGGEVGMRETAKWV